VIILLAQSLKIFFIDIYQGMKINLSPSSNSINCRPRLMKRRSLVRISHLLSLVWTSQKKKKKLSNSKIVPIGKVGDVEGLSRILGCGVASVLIKYLGLPLGTQYNASTIWSSIIDKMEHRLAGLKGLYLSKGGRLTLIKTTLSNLPTYYLSLFLI
jgi:hypothetical protein